MSDIQMENIFGIPVDDKYNEKERGEAAGDGNRRIRHDADGDADLDSK
jgi:hypothetical protein